MQLIELMQSGVNEITQTSKQQQEDSSPVPLEQEAHVPTTLPHCPISA